MKRAMFLLLIGLVCLSGSTVSAEGQQKQAGIEVPYPKVQIKIEGECDGGVCGEGYKINSTSYVPIRVILETMGAEVEWDEKTQTATILRNQELNRENKEYYQAYITETEQLYEEFENELERLIILEHQISMMNEMFDKFNDKTRYDTITKGKMREHQKVVDDITKKLSAYQEAYGNKNPDMIKVINISDQLKAIVTQYQLALDAFEKYVSSKDNQQYKNYLLMRINALEMIENTKTELSKLQETL